MAPDNSQTIVVVTNRVLNTVTYFNRARTQKPQVRQRRLSLDSGVHVCPASEVRRRAGADAERRAVFFAFLPQTFLAARAELEDPTIGAHSPSPKHAPRRACSGLANGSFGTEQATRELVPSGSHRSTFGPLSGKGCDFCSWPELTAADVFGRRAIAEPHSGPCAASALVVLTPPHSARSTHPPPLLPPHASGLSITEWRTSTQ